MDELDFLEMFTDVGTSPSAYQYWHQLLHNRTIVFNVEIDEDIVERIYLPLRDFENDSSQAPVTLILHSPGGSVSDGYFLAEYISQYKKPLNIIVLGFAASMAAVILCGGGGNPNVKRYCYPSTYILLHDGYISLSSSETKTAEDFIAYNKRVDTSIRQFILDHTKITAEEYDARTRQQWFLDGEELKKYGIVDEILGEDNNAALS